MDRSLPAGVADWLLSGDSGPRHLIGKASDLSRVLVIVPTGTSGRRLEAWLARTAAGQGLGGVLLPTLVTPSVFLDLGTAAGSEACPDPVAETLLWMRVLAESPVERLPSLFRVPPSQSTDDPAWQRTVAGALVEARRICGEGGLRFTDVAGREGVPERDRWRDLARLEERYLQCLAEEPGRVDRIEARVARVREPGGSLKTCYDGIVVAGLPDPLPLMIDRLAAEGEAGMPVTVLTYGDALPVDAWGRPAPAADAVLNDGICFEAFVSQVHLRPEPGDQADAVVEVMEASGVDRTAVCLLDPSLERPVRNRSRDRGLEVHDPAGRALAEAPLFHLLKPFVALILHGRLEDAARVLRHPDFLRAVGARWSESAGAFREDRLLADWDAIAALHLPGDFRAFVSLVGRDEAWWVEQATLSRTGRRPAGELRFALKFLDRLGSDAGNETGAEAVFDRILTTLFSQREWVTGSDEAVDFGRVGDAIRDVLEPVMRDRGPVRDWSPLRQLELTLELAAEAGLHHPTRVAENEGAAAPVEFEGWLELLWEDQPALVVAGFNEGWVPASISAHAFLPDSLREELGLSHNASRWRRDAWLLATLLQTHRSENGGRLDLILGSLSSGGDPLRPSGLLFRCPQEALPGRVTHLIREADDRDSVPAWSSPWELPVKPPEGAKALSGIAVTAMRDYLQCPFRYYLKRVRYLQSAELNAVEMNAMDFGNLAHAALEAMGRDERMIDSTDAVEIGTFLLDQARDDVRQRYGDRLSIPLQLQLDSLEKRLSSAAKCQAAERSKGWRIVAVEQKLHEDPELALSIGGLPLRGVIDRVEQNEETGEWRVLDYKTGNQADEPAKKHWRGLWGDRPAHLRDYAFFEREGKTVYWTDLQLPLYALAVQQWKGEVPQCGYFNLPKETGKTGVKELPLDDAILEAARGCAEGVAGDVLAGRFLPAAEKVFYDEFERLLFQRPDLTIRGQVEAVETSQSMGEEATR